MCLYVGAIVKRGLGTASMTTHAQVFKKCHAFVIAKNFGFGLC